MSDNQLITSFQKTTDSHSRAAFVKQTFSTTPNLLLPNEQTIHDNIFQTLSTSKDEQVPIDNRPFFPKFVSSKNDGVVIGSCTGVVQTSPEDLLAYMYLTDTHEARATHIAANGPDSSKYPNKKIHTINDHHHITYSCRKLPPPLNPRDWLTRNIIQRVDADTIKYFCTSINDDEPDLPPNFTKTTLHNAIRGEISMIHEYERLPHDQTRFTLRLKVDIKGSVPKKIANMGMSGALNTVYHAYKYFQRDEEIDELEVSLLK